MKRYLLFPCLLLTATSAGAEDAWHLPLKLTDENTHIEFNVDTTWHVVTGVVHGVSGSAQLSNPNDAGSVAAEIHVPVTQIDTGWGMRNDSLYEHMAAPKFPEIVFTATSLAGGCTPEALEKAPCHGTLHGRLHIRDVEHEIDLPLDLKKEGDHIVASGEYKLEWASYHVDDPSIVMAKVEPVVAVTYRVELPAGTTSTSEQQAAATKEGE
ncbi:MAG: YceI family protein [Bdellovibrionales bacterium]|nr:YceI family protein [Bdellovibrionales bacterium]